MAASDLAEMGANTSTQPPHPGRSLPPILYRRRHRSPSSDPRDSGSSEELRRRGPKRRKLDADIPTPRKPSIKYGHFGQVEPGRLQLEILSCDGGEFRDPRHPSTYLGSRNLLRHDKSVYCSERPSSGIVLRHADDTPFCLEKLHIIGPEHGFPAPYRLPLSLASIHPLTVSSVRDGLVYVAMSLHDLSKYMDPPQHARLRGVHSPPYRRFRVPRSSSEQITLSDALRDPEVSAALDARDPDYAGRADAAHDLSDDRAYSYSEYYNQRFADPHCENPSFADVSDVVLNAEDGIVPVALLSDEEPGPEDSSTQEVLDFRLQRLRTMRRRFDMENWDREENWTRLNEPYDGNERDRDGSWNLRHLDAMMARSRMADPPHTEENADDRDHHERHPSHPAATSYDQASYMRPEELEYYDDGLKDPNVTRARFHIRRGQYKITIKFDPPVSGRFILLKLWANRSNVAVQSVIAKGYGGARFFPALEFR